MLVTYYAMFNAAPSSPLDFGFLIAMSYICHGIFLSYLTSILNSLLSQKEQILKTQLRAWFLHRINASCHFNFVYETFLCFLVLKVKWSRLQQPLRLEKKKKKRRRRTNLHPKDMNIRSKQQQHYPIALKTSAYNGYEGSNVRNHNHVLEATLYVTLYFFPSGN